MVPLKALFATAYEDGDIRSNPTLGVRLRVAREEEHTAKALGTQDLAAFLAACPDEWRTFFTFLTQTGLRISEALGLNWEEVELGTRPRVKVRYQFYEGQRTRLKTRYSRREVPLTQGMTASLLALRRHGFQPEAPVWANAVGNYYSSHNVRKRVLTPTATTVGLEWIGFHTFRHTCASLLFAGGKSIKQVQEWLGHADPAFTMRTYVHLIDEGLGSAEFLDSIARTDADLVLDSGARSLKPR
jgi:integrase